MVSREGCVAGHHFPVGPFWGQGTYRAGWRGEAAGTRAARGVLTARGRDASDVSISTTLGPNEPGSFKV